MTAKIKIEVEDYITDGGGRNAKIWVSSYENIDPNIFVLKEEFDMFHNKVTQSFHTVATPALMCEYPVDVPENEGGFYRTDHIYVSFEKQSTYQEFMQDINRRIEKLCFNTDFLNDKNNYKTESVITKYGELVFEYTDSKSLSNCLNVTLPEESKILLVKKTDNLGTLFLDVCTDEDMLTYPDEEKYITYRTNQTSLCGSYRIIEMVKSKLLELI